MQHISACHARPIRTCEFNSIVDKSIVRDDICEFNSIVDNSIVRDVDHVYAYPYDTAYVLVTKIQSYFQITHTVQVNHNTVLCSSSLGRYKQYSVIMLSTHSKMYNCTVDKV